MWYCRADSPCGFDISGSQIGRFTRFETDSVPYDCTPLIMIEGLHLFKYLAKLSYTEVHRPPSDTLEFVESILIISNYLYYRYYYYFL